jgi:hypothetical protein
MREAPFKLALFSILITVIRIAMFVLVIDKGYGTALARLFAISFAFLMAAGTYLSAFAIRFKNSRGWGIFALIIFGLGDFTFNEAAVIYVTSSNILIPPESTFLNWTEADLLHKMQQLTLAFGAMPTLAAAVLGGMQASFYKVTELNKAGLIGRITAAFGKIITGWGFGMAIKLEGKLPKVTVNGGGDKSRQSDGYDWRLLSDADRADLVGKDTRQIMAIYPGMPERTALNWFYRVSGKKLSSGKKN